MDGSPQRRPLSRHLRRRRRRPGSDRSHPSCRPAACCRCPGSRARACSTTRRRIWPSAIAWRRRCSGPGGIRSRTTGSSTAIRISATTRCFADEGGEPGGINLLDYGCIRIFPPSFVEGVVELYRGCRPTTATGWSPPTRPGAYKNLKADVIDVLNIWARFIYGPLLDDRVRTVADGVSPAAYGREQAFRCIRR